MSSEKRKHLRYDFSRPVAYNIQPLTNSDISIGLTADISNSGLSICTECLLEKGQQILLRSPLPLSGREAVVRWSRKIGEGLFKIGLEIKG